MELFIRDAQERDMDGVMQVHVNCIQRVCSSYYGAEMGQRQPWLLILDQYSKTLSCCGDGDDNIFAFAYVGILSPEMCSSKMDFELHKLYVSPVVGRRGIGRKLLEELERRVSNDGGNGIALKSSMNAVPFYEACGYRCIPSDVELTAQVGEALIKYKRLEKLIPTKQDVFS